MSATQDDVPGDDLQITKVDGRYSVGGRWVHGTLDGHTFEALVFPEHADDSSFEIGGNGADGSRISKLWIARRTGPGRSDRATVFNWDRGEDVPPTDARTQAIVDFLCGGLAALIYGQ